MKVVLLCAGRRGLLFLQKLCSLASGAELCVFSFPEEPWEPPFLEDIRRCALSNGCRFIQTRRVETAMDFWQEAGVDVMLAVGWRYLVPPGIFRGAVRRAYVFHDSLLPKYRGFSPTVWAMINGEVQTGVSLITMQEAVDAGDLVDQQPVAIGPDESIAEVMQRVTTVYLALLERNWPALAGGDVVLRPQDAAQATYGCKRLPSDNQVDWCWPTDRIYHLIRGVSHPYPGAFTTVQGRRLRIWGAARVAQEARYVGRVPGRVVQVHPGQGVVVLTGDGSLLLTRAQWDDGEEMPADQVIGGLSTTLGR